MVKDRNQPPLNVAATTRYVRASKLARKRGKKMTLLIAVVNTLRNRQPLAARHRDHALTGEMKGLRECHVEPDWLLIDRVDETATDLIRDRTGTHSDLFG